MNTSGVADLPTIMRPPLLGRGRRISLASIGLAFSTLLAIPLGVLGLAVVAAPIVFALALLGIRVSTQALAVTGAVWLTLAPLMLVDALADAVSRGIFRLRLPSSSDEARLARRWGAVCRHAAVDPSWFHLRIDRAAGINAASGARTIVAVTRQALVLPDRELDAILAHELGHHAHYHSVWGALAAWLLLPLAVVDAIVRALLAIAGRLPFPLGLPFKAIAIVIIVLILIIALPFLWARGIASRPAEHEADAYAVRAGGGKGLLAVLGSFASDEGRWPSSFIEAATATHPPCVDRMQRVRGLLARGGVS